MILNKFFPSIIGADVNKKHESIQHKIVERCYDLRSSLNSGGENWISSDTYNTIGKHDVFSDFNFLDVNNFVVDKVKDYCEQLHFKKNFIDYKPNSSWFNIYKKGDYQEYHHHGNSILSVVYFLKVSKSPANIYFKSPYLDMIAPHYEKYTPDTFERVNFKPQPGMILIFRSHLEHSVEKQIDNEDRISIAYNFRSNNERT